MTKKKNLQIPDTVLNDLEQTYKVIPLGHYIIVENVSNLFKIYLHYGCKLTFTKDSKRVIIMYTTVQRWFDYFAYYSIFDVVRAEQQLTKEHKSLSINNIYEKLKQRKDVDYE